MRQRYVPLFPVYRMDVPLVGTLVATVFQDEPDFFSSLSARPAVSVVKAPWNTPLPAEKPLVVD